MEKSEKLKELREIMCVARMLRKGASGVGDRVLADLYLRTAAALEDRASRIAFGSPDPSQVLGNMLTVHGPLNLVC